MTPDKSHVTGLLARWGEGDDAPRNEVMEVVYGELHRLARGQLRRERIGHTLETRALINEVYLRLVDLEQVDWESRGHFFRIAARTMRRILIDHARHHGYQKRGGGVRPETLEEGLHVASPVDYVALDDALEALAALDPNRARLVELRFFGGFTHGEIAELEGVSVATIDRRWRVARGWLYKALKA